ncbi:MAG: magnesium transporter [Lachnospiraceae bacterium]|nr:magnesium transporter [Lachnospiraceae bacterium]
MAITEMEMEQLTDLAEKKQFKRLKEILCEMNEVDIAEVMNELPPERALVTFRLLPKDLGSEVFACLEIEEQQHIINSMEDQELKTIIEDLAIDDAVDMVEELPASVVKRILKAATPATRKLINQYLQYPENSAGSIMTAEYVALRPSMTVEESFAYIRKNGVDKETIYTCYVINPQRKLLGVVTLKDLLMNPYETKIEDIMDDNIIFSLTTDDQEEVAGVFNKYGLLALPVVDKENRLVGIVTVDDIVDVMEQEATEDFQKMAAMAPSEKSYLKTSVFELAKNRIPWLLILMLSSTVSGQILNHYESAFVMIPLLVSFVPTLMDTGGNSGSQASTLIIRGMATGEIQLKDILKVVWKELRVGILCGALLAVINFIRLIIMYPGNTMVCVTVVISMFFTVILAKTLGVLLPMLAKAIHLDPALMASPMLTTIVDACSMFIYFTLATRVLSL